MNKKFPFMFAVFLFLLIPNVSAEFLIHNGNTVTTGNIVWHIQSDYLTQFLKIKIIPINETCVNIHTEPTDYLLQLYEDSQSMNTGDFNKKYVHLQKGTRNVLSDVKTLDKVPIEALKGFSLRHIKHTKDFNTFDALESNDLQVCNIAKGNYIKFGFGTTTIEITNATTHLTLNPETTYCLMNCEHEITLFNNDTVAHSISINNITVENPSEMQNVKFYAYVPVNISVPIYANKTEYFEINLTDNLTGICNQGLDNCHDYNDTYCACDFKDMSNITGYKNVTVEKWVNFDSYNVDTGETLKLKLMYDVPLNTNGKFNITINFDGYYFNIDPYWNSNWNGCNNITITETSGYNITDKEIIVNLTGLTFASTDEIRIVNASCNEGGSEIPRDILSSGSDYAEVLFMANLTASSNTTYSVYYNNPSAPSPSYSDKVTIDNNCSSSDCTISVSSNIESYNYTLNHDGGDLYGTTITTSEGAILDGNEAGYGLEQYGLIFYKDVTTATCSIIDDGVLHLTISCKSPDGDYYNYTFYANNKIKIISALNHTNLTIRLGSRPLVNYYFNGTLESNTEEDFWCDNVTGNTCMITSYTKDVSYPDFWVKTWKLSGIAWEEHALGEGIGTQYPYLDIGRDDSENAALGTGVMESAFYFVVNGTDGLNETQLANKYKDISANQPIIILSLAPPNITIVSPLNQTYPSLPIPINLTTDEAVSCWWNLDGGTNHTLNGLETNWYGEITGISEGTYTFYAYCNDTYTNIGFNTTIFTYTIPEPEISDEVIAGAVIIVISLIFAIVNYILRLV